MGIISPFTKANAVQEKKANCDACSLKDQYTKEEVLEELKKAGVTVNETTKNDQQLVKKVIKQHTKMDKAVNKQLLKGFKEKKDSEMFITFNNTSLGGYDYEKAIVFATLLKNKDGDISVVSAWVDAKKEEIIKYTVGTVTNADPEKYNELVAYEKAKKVEGDFSASGFTFNGKSFACSMTGVFTCVVYCGVVGMACGPGAPACGTICDIVCGAAFAYGCS